MNTPRPISPDWPRAQSPTSNASAAFALLFAALAIAARLPFLISGKIAFDSDEAVEGLMARHVLNGEFPAFFWGQAFKGVPEVYAAAGAFAVFGPGVTVLKSVTLSFFAAYVALNFVLLDRMAGRWIAVAASLLLIVGPPALVFWSLDASAEYVLVMLLGTILLLLCLRHEEAGRAEGSRLRLPGSSEQATAARRSARREGGRAELILAAIGFVIGVGFWVHQIFAFYLLPAVIVFVFQSDWWKQRRFGRPAFPALALGTIAVIYLALAVFAFVTGGFSVQLGSMTVSARVPQKMLRIAAGMGGLALMAHLAANASRETVRQFARRYWPLGAGFLVGYAPVLLYSALVDPARSPARVGDARQLMRAAPDILFNVIPILSGFKLATTERLDIPLAAAAMIVAALATYVETIRHRLAAFARLRPDAVTLDRDFFPLFIAIVPLLFIASGAYLDTQSYRYLVPYYAGLCVALAAGCLLLAKDDKKIASVFVGMLLIVFALQQVVWFNKLTPDTQSAKSLECLRREGVRGGFADYWTSYKLTFLSNEEIILAPSNGVDRYPAFTDFVRSLPDNRHKVEECVVSP